MSPEARRYPEVVGTNEQCPLAFSLAALYLLSFSLSHLRTGRPTSGGCTLINGNLAERATSRPYTPTAAHTTPNEKRAGSGASSSRPATRNAKEKSEKGPGCTIVRALLNPHATNQNVSVCSNCNIAIFLCQF